MPRVPRSETPQVAARAAPNVQLTARGATPEAFGASVGRGLQAVGTTAMEQALKHQGEEDETLSKQSISGLRREVNEVQYTNEDAYYRKEGKDAYDAVDSQTKLLEKVRQRHRDTLKTDRQKDMYGSVAMRIIDAEIAEISKHSTNEFKKWQDTEDDSAIILSQESAALQHSNPERIALERGTIIASVDNKAERNGWDEGTKELELQIRISAMYKGVIGARMIDDPTGALEYFKEHEGEMSAGDRAIVEKALKGEVAKAEAYSNFDDIRLKPLTYSEQVVEARKIEDVEVRKLTVQLIDEDHARKTRADAAKAKEARVSAIQKVEDSGSIGDLTVAEREAVTQTPGGLASLERRAKQISEGVDPAQDQTLWTEFALTPLDELAKMTAEEYKLKYIDKFDQAHYDQGLNMVRSAKSADAKEQRRLLKQQARYTVVNAATKRVVSGLSKSKKKKMGEPVGEAMLQWADDFFEDNARNPTATEANKYAAQLMLEGEYDIPWSLFNDGRYVEALRAGEAAQFTLDIGTADLPRIATATGVDLETLPTILRWMEESNIPITVENVTKANEAGRPE